MGQERDVFDGADDLLDVGRAWRGGIEVRRYASGGERLIATVAARKVFLKRRLGTMGAGLTVSLDELAVLARFGPKWIRRSTSWAAFYDSCAGYPPGWGCGATWYQPAGHGKRVKIGEVILGKLKGEGLRGRVDERHLHRPRVLLGDLRFVAKLVHVGERYGDPDGERIGALFELGDLSIRAERDELTLSRGAGEVVIEKLEANMIEMLARVEQEGGR